METGHTFAMLEETPAMVCSRSLKIAGKCLNALHHVAGPIWAVVLGPVNTRLHGFPCMVRPRPFPRAHTLEASGW